MRAMRAALLLLATAAVLALGACGGGDNTVGGPTPKAAKKMRLTSPYFRDGQRIPARFTCDGEDVSPALEWSKVPPDARELALLVEDPNKGGSTFVHWIAWGILPPREAVPVAAEAGTLKQGKNSFGDIGYGGPCPPKGDPPHRYVFNIYALRTPLGLPNGADAQTVRQAIAPVADAQGILTGTYGR
jgi:Raf kinase inhibitor-like YbhB/YbcL family protein